MEVLRSSDVPRGCVERRTVKKKKADMEFTGEALMAMERVSVVIDPAKVVELCNAFCSLMGPTRAERGCLRCELYTSWTGSNTVLMESLWRTREDLIQHLKSDRYKSFLQLMEMSTKQPLIEFFIVSRTHGLDIVEEARERFV
jgi:quinol monooxygenase YgiN